MIGGMRDLGGRVLIGLAVLIVGAMAVGYAFIFRGVATAPSGLGTLEVPAAGQIVAARLDDGRPVFVGAGGGTAWVLDAREPRESGELDVLLSWCPSDELFIGTGPLSIFTADGSSLRDADGMTAYAAVPVEGDASRIRVEAQTSVRPAADEVRQPEFTCGPDDWVVHRPEPDDVFDPSVATNLEPPGWTWLEGSVQAIGGQALLCDGREPGGACPEGAVARGIDPATLPAEGVAGLFLGRVHDGAIEGLTYAPQP